VAQRALARERAWRNEDLVKEAARKGGFSMAGPEDFDRIFREYPI
jgi:hypothetical protein